MHPEIHSETRWLTQDSERTRDPKTFHRGLTLFSGLLPALKVRPQRTRHSGLWPQCCLTGRKPQIQTSGGSHTSCKFSCETLPFFWAFTPTEGLHQGSHLCHLSDKRFKGGKVSISQHDAYDSSLCHFNLPKPMIQRPSKNDTMVFPHLDFALPRIYLEPKNHMLHLGAAVRVVKKKTCSQHLTARTKKFRTRHPQPKKKNNGHETKRLNNHSIAIPPPQKKKQLFQMFFPQ